MFREIHPEYPSWIPLGISSVVILGVISENFQVIPSGIPQGIPSEIPLSMDSSEILKVPQVVLSRVPSKFPSVICCSSNLFLNKLAIVSGIPPKDLFQFPQAVSFVIPFEDSYF